VKNFFLIGVGPVTGALILSYLFARAIDESRRTDQSYSGSEVFGVAVPVVLGLGLLLLGVVLMLIWRAGGHEDFFGRRRETVDPDVAAGRRMGVAAVPEEAV
jgi:prolipoprotein diacylglyceryltransferase